MFRNHYITIAAWIIVYISLWLSRDNLVSSKFSKNNCHTGFVSRIIETMIFPFQWYKNRPTYEYVVGLVLLCCISVVAVIKCFSVFSSIEQPMIEAIFEHCNFTFILVHLKRLIPYAFSFSSKSTETLLSELQKAAKGNAVAQAILRYQQDNSFKCKSDSDQISIQKFFPTCGLMDEYFRWLLL